MTFRKTLLMRRSRRPGFNVDDTPKVEDQIKLIEAQASAKEVASKFIGKYGILLIVFLVCVGVFAATILPAEALTPVVGLVSTAAMALIGILTGITGSLGRYLFFTFSASLASRLMSSADMPFVVLSSAASCTG